jgi:hypothetical protein
MKKECLQTEGVLDGIRQVHAEVSFTLLNDDSKAVVTELVQGSNVIPTDIASIASISAGLIKNNKNTDNSVLYVLKNQDALESQWCDVSLFEKFNQSSTFKRNIIEYKNKLNDLSLEEYITAMSEESNAVLQSLISLLKINGDYSNLNALSNTLIGIQNTTVLDGSELLIKQSINVLTYAVPVFLSPTYLEQSLFINGAAWFAPYDILANGLQNMCVNVNVESLSWVIKTQARLEGLLPGVSLYNNFFTGTINPVILKLVCTYNYRYRYTTLGLVYSFKYVAPLFLSGGGLKRDLTYCGSIVNPDIPLLLGTVGYNPNIIGEGFILQAVSVMLNS